MLVKSGMPVMGLFLEFPAPLDQVLNILPINRIVTMIVRQTVCPFASEPIRHQFPKDL
jgi:hypothetical protein